MKVTNYTWRDSTVHTGYMYNTCDVCVLSGNMGCTLVEISSEPLRVYGRLIHFKAAPFTECVVFRLVRQNTESMRLYLRRFLPTVASNYKPACLRLS